MEYLVAVDLEGIGEVAGAPYQTLNGSPDYDVAKKNAVREINAAVSALFDNGATRVAVWDNHGGGGNLDFSLIDKRAEKINTVSGEYRFDFARRYNFKGVIYLGYHAMEGTPCGVLAHTYSSVAIQYMKINGRAVGELEIDSYCAAKHGIAPIFLASDDVCTAQFKKTSPDTVTVVTKYGKGRNKADFKPEDEVVREIYEGVARAAKADIAPVSIETPVKVEIRYTRAERADEVYTSLIDDESISVKYGEDTHILHFETSEIRRIPYL